MLVYIYWREKGKSPKDRVLYVSYNKDIDLFGDEEYILEKGEDGILVDEGQIYDINGKLHCVEFEIDDVTDKTSNNNQIYFNAITEYYDHNGTIYYWINIFDDARSSISNLREYCDDVHNELSESESDDEEKQCFKSLKKDGCAEMETLYNGEVKIYAWSMIINK
jgi:hypothetical protein